MGIQSRNSGAAARSPTCCTPAKLDSSLRSSRAGSASKANRVMSSGCGVPLANFSNAFEDVVDDQLCTLATVFDCSDQPLFTPLVAGRVDGLGDAVAVDKQKIAGFNRQRLLFVGAVGEEAKDGATAFESDDLLAAQQQRRIVACVDVGERTRLRLVEGRPRRWRNGFGQRLRG